MFSACVRRDSSHQEKLKVEKCYCNKFPSLCHQWTGKNFVQVPLHLEVQSLYWWYPVDWQIRNMSLNSCDNSVTKHLLKWIAYEFHKTQRQLAKKCFLELYEYIHNTQYFLQSKKHCYLLSHNHLKVNTMSYWTLGVEDIMCLTWAFYLALYFSLTFKAASFEWSPNEWTAIEPVQ